MILHRFLQFEKNVFVSDQHNFDAFIHGFIQYQGSGINIFQDFLQKYNIRFFNGNFVFFRFFQAIR